MNRAVLRIILDVVGSIVVALVLLTLWLWFLSGSFAEGVSESARLLFLFMDVGLIVWVVLVVIAAVRSRGAGPGVGRTILLALVGAAVNVVVVTIVGFVQGGWAPLFVVFAIEGGIALLIAAAVIVPLVHRAVKAAPSA